MQLLSVAATAVFMRRSQANGEPILLGSEHKVHPVQSGWWVKLWQHCLEVVL